MVSLRAPRNQSPVGHLRLVVPFQTNTASWADYITESGNLAIRRFEGAGVRS